MDVSADLEFSSIPVIAFRKVVDFLPLRDIIVASKVCCEWRNFILSSNHIWNTISIDLSTPFGGEWTQVNMHRHSASDEFQDVSAVDNFLLDLANTTHLIENVKFNIWVDTLSPYTFHTLLMKQQRIVSLVLPHGGYDCFDNPEVKKLSEVYFDVILRHQSTLEYLDVSKAAISLRNWVKFVCSSSIEFPELKSIIFPQYCNRVTTEDAIQCCHQIFKSRKAQELNMVEELFACHAGMIRALRSTIQKRFLPNLQRILLDCIDETYDDDETWDDNKTMPDFDILIKCCPQLTHLHCSIDRPGWSISLLKGQAFKPLIYHYSKKLISLCCDIDDTLAEVISNCCQNLTVLTIVDQDSMPNCRHKSKQFLSDKGLLALGKLTKLQILTLIINRNEAAVTADGMINFFSTSTFVANVKELTLHLPCLFYNERKLFQVLSNSSAPFEKLYFRLARTEKQQFLNHRILTGGVQKVLENSPPLKHFGVDFQGRGYEVTEQPSIEAIELLANSIITLHSSLKSLILYTKLPKIPKAFIIKSLPYCSIRILCYGWEDLY